MNEQPLFQDSEIRTLKVICIALSVGVALFAVIAIFLASEEPSPGSARDSAMGMLRVIHLVVTLGAIVLQKILFERVMSGKIRPRGTVGPTSFSKTYLSASIMRLAIVEGAALFGLVIALIGSTGGQIAGDPTYYLHLIPAILLIMTARMTYPSARRVEELARQYPNERR